jgi:hypothetical protein
MQIVTRLSMSVDGYVTTPSGWPTIMGRTTFEPALGNDRWPWPELDAFVLGSTSPSVPGGSVEIVYACR